MADVLYKLINIFNDTDFSCFLLSSYPMKAAWVDHWFYPSGIWNFYLSCIRIIPKATVWVLSEQCAWNSFRRLPFDDFARLSYCS